MAEQVNQRIERMINELEQMRRTGLFNEEEIREISRKRKEFEYRIQRRVKDKEDFVHYIAYELALLEDISVRRKLTNLKDLKKDIEYAMAKHLNQLFKQFIYRFQNDIEVYFQYIKFCMGVGFEDAVSGIISQMLQIHGDKPKSWLLASKWETEQQKNFENARNFLLKGIHRHPNSECLFLELFRIELTLIFQAKTEDKDKHIKRTEIIWRNGVKTIQNVLFLCQLYDLSLKYGADETIVEGIKEEIWSKRNEKEIAVYIANKELEGQHWKQIEDFSIDDLKFPPQIKNYIVIFEKALEQFPDQKLCTKYIHGLLSINVNDCDDLQKICAVEHAWMYGHQNNLLSEEMYTFGIDMFKLQKLHEDKLMEIIDTALNKNKNAPKLWKEKLLLNKSDENKMLSILNEATMSLNPDDAIQLWNTVMDIVQDKASIKKLYQKFQNCDNRTVLSLKPKLLQKMYEQSNLKAAREMYEEMIKTPPTQIELHYVMIDIESAQEKPNNKNIRKFYECCVQHHGHDNIGVWVKYIKFENEYGNPQAAPALYRRAIGALKKELVDEFIRTQTMTNLGSE